MQLSWFICWLVVMALRMHSVCQDVDASYLKASNTDAADQFGFSVAIYGDTVVVGAPYEDSAAIEVQANNAAADSGAAYIFAKNGESWTQQAYLKASNTRAGAKFGSSVAIYGNAVVVGAPGEDFSGTGVDGGAVDSGAAYVFIRHPANGTWTQQQYLKASNSFSLGFFGCSVAIYADTVLVGSLGESSSSTGVNGSQLGGALFSGAAYVFTRFGAAWNQQAYLKASNTEASDQFGHSVAIYEDTAVVGAYAEGSSAIGVNGNQENGALFSGAVYVFTRAGGTWAQEAYIKASNTAVDDYFGYSVAIYGDTLVVGARYEDSNATGFAGDQQSHDTANSGAVYVFTRSGTTWSQQSYLKASNTGSIDQFGYSVALFGDSLLVGAPFEDSNGLGINANDNNAANNSGAAYGYNLSGTSAVVYIKASNTDANDQFAQAVSLSGTHTVICAPGESSATMGVTGQGQSDNAASMAGACYVYTTTSITPTVPSTSEASTVASTTTPSDTTIFTTSTPSATSTTSIPTVTSASTTTASSTTSTTATMSDTSESSSSNNPLESTDQDSDTSSFVAPVVITSVLAIAIIGGLSVVFFVLWRRKGAEKDHSDVPLSDISHKVDMLHNVTMKEVIGKGAFGEVYLGECDGTPCACKKLSSSDVEESMKEAKTLFQLSHPNIVRLIGIHISPPNDTYLVMEYVRGGSLTNFLPRMMGSLTMNHLVHICIGIAQGMAYLQRKGIVHRDLAARNILINASNLQAMISDFGMSRENLYQRSSTSKIPVKWSAPEVIQQGDCTSQSDMFSFGIVLWEIFSYAVMPFNGLSNDEAAKIICNRDIKEKLSKPDNCPDKLYQLMVRCWSFEASARPSFQDALTQLQSINAPLPQDPSQVYNTAEDQYNA